MAAAARSNQEEFTGLRVRAMLKPVPEGQTSLRAYIPVSAYVPVFCIMAESGADSLAGAHGAIAPIAPGAITYVINNVRVTWIPPGQNHLYVGEQ